MSMPPAGDDPSGDWPSHAQGPPPDQPPAPPPGYPYGAYPPPPGYPYGPPTPPPSPPRRISVGMVFVGPLIYAGLNLAIGFMAFVFAGSTTNQASNVVFAVTAVVLALIAFGGGAVLLLLRSPYAKGIGLGLMIGWALTSVFTVGFCTGINPGLYTL
ncbi:hypothetical protein BH11ACT6_BH11ACT6_19780 [soil metagenome]